MASVEERAYLVLLNGTSRDYQQSLKGLEILTRHPRILSCLILKLDQAEARLSELHISLPLRWAQILLLPAASQGMEDWRAVEVSFNPATPIGMWAA